MSHFTRVRTQLRNMATVGRALEEMGYEVEESTAVRGYRGQEAKADLVIRANADYDIGFRQEDDNVVVVADFWGLRMDRDKFTQQLAQTYAHLTITEQAEARGWQLATEEVQEDGSIKLVMQRWS